MIAPNESMRAWRQEGAPDGIDLGYFSPEFYSAIDDEADSDRVRELWWYVVKFDVSRSRVLERLLRIVGLKYQIFVYEHHRPRRRPTIRSWIPGYFFVEFDINRDRWRQMLDIPGVMEVLGAPTALPAHGEGSVENLVSRCPVRVNPEGDELESIPRGTTVRILRGTFAGEELRTVTWSERKRVRVLLVFFNRVIEPELRTRDVEVVA